MRLFISGQRTFGRSVLDMCLSEGHEIAGVCCPMDDSRMRQVCSDRGIQTIPSGMLSVETMPSGVDLGITAHSFDYVGRRTRFKPRYKWIGYHPSLLPRHRGRSSIEWAIRMREPVTGGTVFWLDDGIDRGDIAYQDWCWIDPAMWAMQPSAAASILWREQLQDIGLRLLRKALSDISAGRIVRKKQDERFSTWEPHTAVKDIYRPDSLMLPAPQQYDR